MKRWLAWGRFYVHVSTTSNVTKVQLWTAASNVVTGRTSMVVQSEAQIRGLKANEIIALENAVDETTGLQHPFLVSWSATREIMLWRVEFEPSMDIKVVSFKGPVVHLDTPLAKVFLIDGPALLVCSSDRAHIGIWRTRSLLLEDVPCLSSHNAVCPRILSSITAQETIVCLCVGAMSIESELTGFKSLEWSFLWLILRPDLSSPTDTAAWLASWHAIDDLPLHLASSNTTASILAISSRFDYNYIETFSYRVLLGSKVDADSDSWIICDIQNGRFQSVTTLNLEKFELKAALLKKDVHASVANGQNGWTCLIDGKIFSGEGSIVIGTDPAGYDQLFQCSINKDTAWCEPQSFDTTVAGFKEVSTTLAASQESVLRSLSAALITRRFDGLAFIAKTTTMISSRKRLLDDALSCLDAIILDRPLVNQNVQPTAFNNDLLPFITNNHQIQIMPLIEGVTRQHSLSSKPTLLETKCHFRTDQTLFITMIIQNNSNETLIMYDNHIHVIVSTTIINCISTRSSNITEIPAQQQVQLEATIILPDELIQSCFGRQIKLIPILVWAEEKDRGIDEAVVCRRVRGDIQTIVGSAVALSLQKFDTTHHNVWRPCQTEVALSQASSGLFLQRQQAKSLIQQALRLSQENQWLVDVGGRFAFKCDADDNDVTSNAATFILQGQYQSSMVQALSSLAGALSPDFMITPARLSQHHQHCIHNLLQALHTSSTSLSLRAQDLMMPVEQHRQLLAQQQQQQQQQKPAEPQANDIWTVWWHFQRELLQQMSQLDQSSLDFLCVKFVTNQGRW